MLHRRGFAHRRASPKLEISPEASQLIQTGVVNPGGPMSEWEREGEHFASLLKGPEAREALNGVLWRSRKPVFD